MDKDISGGCLMGRPFGGVGILVNNTLVPNVRLVKLQVGISYYRLDWHFLLMCTFLVYQRLVVMKNSSIVCHVLWMM